MTINIYLSFTIFLILGIILPIILIFTLRKKQKTLKIITIIFLILYLIALFIGTTFSIDFNNPNISIKPNFNNNWFSMNFIAFSGGTLNIILNLSMFLPLGFAIFVLSKNHKFMKTILISFIISLIIELMQFILPIYRTTEILDIILNTISGTISAICCTILTKLNAFNDN